MNPDSPRGNLIEEHSPKKHGRRLRYAVCGLKHVFLNEANFRVHIAAALVVFALAYALHFSVIEWLFLTFAVGFVLITEVVNTLLELVVDHLIQEHHEGAKVIKDVGASSVLLAAIISVIIGLLLFGPRLLPVIEKALNR